MCNPSAVVVTVQGMELIEAAGAEFQRILRLVPAEAWDLPTPSNMSVRELVGHVVSGNRLTTALLSGASREDARAARAGDLLGADPVAAVIDSSQAQASAFAATPPRQIVQGPRGEITAEHFLRFRLIDLVVHGWDLLRAAGLEETLDPSLVASLAALVEPHLDELVATGAYGDGPSGALDADASPQTRLLDGLGRRV